MSSLAATETATAFVERRPLERYAEPAQPSLVGLPRAMLAQALAEVGVPEGQRRMRVQQIWHWLYVRGAQDFDAMTTLSKDLRAGLARRFTLARPPIAAEQISVDDTRKWLIQLPGERAEAPHEVECVYIPETDRGTLCISSQVGCTLNCSFCRTGTQQLVRNLTAAEIAAQVVVARDRLGDWLASSTAAGAGRSEGDKRLVSNVVMMGMGEPLYNFEAVRDEIRDVIVPLNKKYPIKDLLDACRTYPGVSNARRITFEYVMLKGVNDSLADAKALVRLLKGIPAKINLIPFNPWPGTKYECSDWDQIEKFSEVVFAAGYASPVRTPRGRDILAACGQLKSASEKLSARERLALRAMAMTD